MATEQQLAVAKEYFQSNPSQGVLHISSDGQVFFQKNYNDGATHQRRIDPARKMTTVFRKAVEAPSTSDEENVPNVPSNKWKKEQITEWLTAGGVSTTGKETKEQLLELVDQTIVNNTDLDENE